ncbi:hypothetical protein [Seonamhaeicola aphaedonensis]|uniref:YhhN-like protein n=1 Tax=Seonamhaeicola aphaedonensis TaxID=1461338 RepID=A0A3D9H8R8_9FLAO|nr:hypothetical protein [Seonamhaeicola aphaedonensis]RED45894.1 hypothetical protein DFQ02_10739 [Seonamhaeicola aphaedonensis]
MYKSKALVSLVLIIYLLFTVYGFMGNENVAFTLDSLILPSIAVFYFLFIKQKTAFFTLFLVCYAGSDLIGLLVDYIPESEHYYLVYDLDYYIGNSLYVTAYVALLIEICKKLNVLHIIKHFKIHLIVLTILSAWVVYVLQKTIVNTLTNSSEYYLELAYNIVMLLLLSGALLNFFCRDNQKSLYLFLGALCIVFSEVIEVAYIYIAQRNLLNFLSTTLTLSAFYFFCKQISILDTKEEELHNIISNSPKSTEV